MARSAPGWRRQKSSERGVKGDQPSTYLVRGRCNPALDPVASGASLNEDRSMPSYLNAVTDRVHRDYTWCGVCERVFPTSVWDTTWWRCPACTAGAETALPWEEIRAEHPEYPATPRDADPYRRQR